jgi:hypothetical protein
MISFLRTSGRKLKRKKRPKKWKIFTYLLEAGKPFSKSTSLKAMVVVKYFSISISFHFMFLEGRGKKRKKVEEDSGSGSDDGGGSDDDRPKKRGRPRSSAKESIKGFSDAEVNHKAYWPSRPLKFLVNRSVVSSRATESFLRL